jgi:hypothetical protein
MESPSGKRTLLDVVVAARETNFLRCPVRRADGEFPPWGGKKGQSSPLTPVPWHVDPSKTVPRPQGPVDRRRVPLSTRSLWGVERFRFWGVDTFYLAFFPNPPLTLTLFFPLFFLSTARKKVDKGVDEVWTGFAICSPVHF